MDLNPVIENAMRVVTLDAKAKDISISAHYPEDAIVISGDPDRLQQVVWNLLSNAIKFTPHGGWISLLVQRRDRDAVLIVRDSGCGIRSEFLPHVFERFRQDENEQGQNREGLGLGLSIVRHIVGLHGGSVEAESGGNDKGATFTVRLPLASEELRNIFPAAPLGSRNVTAINATNLAATENVMGS